MRTILSVCMGIFLMGDVAWAGIREYRRARRWKKR
jgi:hypothetical protein